MPTATLEGLTLHVADLERSIAFYSKVPGADLTLHIPGQFAMFKIGAGRLGLLQHGETKFHVEIETDDLDAMHAALIEAGLEPNGPPTTHEWGQRDFLVYDPDGNMIEFGDLNR
jgi:catechol 2,3-dioxygenase-like lactoylglutathione lyase family enzyme